MDLAPSEKAEEDSDAEEEEEDQEPPQQETLAEALGLKDEEVSITKSSK